MKRTISEEQFEVFCQNRGIPLERIPESDTRTDNTSISAIGALVMTGPDSHILYVYRNRFAKVPLDPGLLRRFGVTHYDLGVREQGLASDWIEIEAPADS